MSLFLKKTVMHNLNYWLAVTLVENKYCTVKDDYLWKAENPSHQKTMFFIATKGVDLSLDIWPSWKAFIRYITKYISHVRFVIS